MTDDTRTIEEVAEAEGWRRLGVLEQERRRAKFYAERGIPDPLRVRSARRITRRIYNDGD